MSIRDQSKANAAARLSRIGGARSAYASGGAVKGRKGFALGGAPMGGDDVGGMPAKPNLGKAGRHGKGGKSDKKKGGTNVNVIVMPSGGDKGGPPMPPTGAGPGGPPPPMPHPPMGPPPGGPPGMPMRKFGGSVKAYAKGGRIANLGKFAHGGKVTAKGKK